MKRKTLKNIFLWLIWALFYGLSYPTYNLNFLIWFAFSFVLYFVYSEPLYKTVFYSYFFSFIYFILTLYWLYGFWFPAPFMLFPVMAIYYSFAFLSTGLIAKKFPKLRVLALPVSWIAMEFFKDVGFHGFHWNLVGDTQWSNPLLVQNADLFSVWGISFLILLVNSVITEVLISYRKERNLKKAFGKNVILLCITSLLIVFSLVYGFFAKGKWEKIIKNSSKERVALLQPNIGSREVWWSKRWYYYGIFWRLHAEAMLKEPEVIFWSETMVRNYIWYYLKKTSENDEVYRFNIRFVKMPQEFGVPILITSPDTEDGVKNYNTADYVDPDMKEIQRNAKIHLVPFGEWMPGYDRVPILKKIMEIEGAGSFVPSTNWNVIKGRKAKFRVLICYEDVFPDLARKFIPKGLNYFVNVTDDGWAYQLGFTHPMYQHTALATITAVSVRRPIARAANSGVTGIILPDGKLIGNIGTYNRGFFVGEIPLIDEKITTFYVKIGYIFPYIIFVFYVIIYLFALLKRKEK